MYGLALVTRHWSRVLAVCKEHRPDEPAHLTQGKGRFVMMDDSMWGMILGKSGKVPGTIDPELIALAEKQGRKFTDDDPHTLLPDALDGFREEMQKNGWEAGPDDEELFELAMHPEQYRNYKSGQAKKNFLADLQKAKDARLGSQLTPEQLAALKHAKADAIVAPLGGHLYYEFGGASECAPCLEPFIGQHYKEGDTFCYIQAKWGEIVPVPSDLGGKLVEVTARQGANVRRGDILGLDRARQGLTPGCGRRNEVGNRALRCVAAACHGAAVRRRAA